MTDKSNDSWPSGGFDPLLSELQTQYFPDLENQDFGGLLCDRRLGNISIVSSFGTESAALIHFVNKYRSDIPIIFIDTHKHFRETIDYRDRLMDYFKFNLIVVSPDAQDLAQEDPDGDLNKYDQNACCTIRKTFPLQDAISEFDAWISGRKRYQGGSRSAIPILERDGEKIKINPLAMWSAKDIAEYFHRHGLPRHPLEVQGYLSIGCAPCTRAVKKGEDARSGRWANNPEKSECGIHLGPDGRFRRIRR